MCMTPGCSGGKSSGGKSGSYTPKKNTGGAKKGSYAPKGRSTTINSFGNPKVKLSFAGRK